MTDQSLIFDESIELIDDKGIVSEGPFWFSTLADVSWGEPQPVEVALNSLLRDGGLVETNSDGNREVSLLVEVQSTDPIGLGQGVALLHRATGKRTTLRWVPPGMDVPTVFEVETSSLHNPGNFDDLAFLKHKQVYRLRLACQPYTRSEDLTTEVAEGIPSVGTVVNAGTSTANWSAPTATVPGSTFGSQVPADPQPADMIAVDESALATKAYRVDQTRYSGFLGGADARRVWNKSTLTQSIALASGAYLSFEVKFDVPVGRSLNQGYGGGTYQDTGVLDSFEIMASAPAGGRTYQKYREKSSGYYLSQGIVESVEDGFTRYTFRIGEAMAVTGLSWTGSQLVPYTTAPALADRPRIKIRNVAVAETATLGQQVLKTLDVGGSARTTGSLHVAAPSDSVALGQVLAYTVPQPEVTDGFRPDLRQWATTISTSPVGGRLPMGVTSVDLPASMFKSGSYTAVLDQYSSAGSKSLTMTATLRIGGVTASSEETELTWTVPEEQGGTWRMFSVGTVYLPPAGIFSPSSDAVLRISWSGASIYDIFLLPTAGDLTIIDCGAGIVGPMASSHLWIDSPSPANQGQGGYWRGTTPTRENALSAWSSTVVPGVHTFNAGQMLAFISSTAAQGPTVSFDYYRRWLAHAAE